MNNSLMYSSGSSYSPFPRSMSGILGGAGIGGDNPAKRRCTSFGPENASCLGETGVEQEVFSFLWTVKNYSVLSEMAIIKSPIFTGGPKTNHGWQLVLYPKRKVEDVEYLSIFLRLNDYGDGVDSADRAVKATVQFYLLNADGRAVRTFKSCGTSGDNTPLEFKKAGNMWGTNKFISSSDLLIPSHKIVVEDAFKIHCEITIIGALKQKVINGGTAKCSPPVEERDKKRMDRMAAELGKMFTDSIATDITVTTGKESFKAHKTILIARSTVFAAMFDVDMREKEMNSLEISDFDWEVVKGMLEHLYSGQTEAMVERAPELLEIAEKYNLPSLKEDCEYSISENLKMQNAAVILVLAHTHNAPYLKQKTIDFINMNRDELLKDKGFKETMKAHASTGGFVDLYLSQS
ncbi:unnamed protein product [Orchesella dallaii]|uniref:Speckle-type POZ protein n=2 Tax=Orchesella dallaii TaxID=48710 RepID=A0ABP1RAR6_9HEXA